MPPTNPRPGLRGLPTNPSPRSRSIGRATLERETSPPSPPSEPSAKIQIAHSHASHNPTELHLPRKSDDYMSSSRSSPLNRKKLGTAYTSRSSGTTLEDNHQPYSRKRPIEHDGRFAPLEQSGGSKERPVSNHDKNREQEVTFNIGDGSAIWNRVATVASTLTVSVSKAWAANVPTYAGEETPPGQESRLTRAMKVYHLAKAKDPTDLPSWLFDESVRRRSTPAVASDNNKDIYQTRQEPSDHLPKLRGLRDVYDAAASTSSIPTSRSTQGHNRIHEAGEPSKAANRLKVIREAKRSALTANAVPRLLSDTLDEHQTVAHDHDDKRKIDRRAPRLGLPPGPRRM